MSIDQETINQMYPSTTAVQTEEVQPVDTPVDEYGYEAKAETVEGNPYASEPDSIEDTLYGAESKVTLSGETDLSVIYQSEEEQAALRDNLGYIASELGGTQDDIHSIVSYANKQLITGDIADPQESMSTLYEQHGQQLSSKLAQAQALVQSLPDVAAWLEATRLGDDPVMINQIIRIAQTPRSQARLQKLLRNTK